MWSDTAVFVPLCEPWPCRGGAISISQPCALGKPIKSCDSAEVFCNPQVNWKINGLYKFVKATELRNFSGTVTDFT